MAKRREVLLSFALQKLQAAEATAKRVIATVTKSKDIAKDVKREIVAGARERLKEIRALKDAESELDGRRRRARDIRKRQIDGLFEDAEDPFESLNGVRRHVNKASQLLDQARSGDITGAALEILSDAGGPLLKVATAITQQVLKVVDEKIAQMVEIRSAQFSAKLEELRYRADYQGRLKNEPAFRRREAARTWEETKRNEAVWNARGWSRSGDYLDGF